MKTATVTIEYSDGTRAWWTVTDDEAESKVETVLGTPEGMKC